MRIRRRHLAADRGRRDASRARTWRTPGTLQCPPEDRRLGFVFQDLDALSPHARQSNNVVLRAKGERSAGHEGGPEGRIEMRIHSHVGPPRGPNERGPNPHQLYRPSRRPSRTRRYNCARSISGAASVVLSDEPLLRGSTGGGRDPGRPNTPSARTRLSLLAARGLGDRQCIRDPDLRPRRTARHPH